VNEKHFNAHVVGVTCSKFHKNQSNDSKVMRKSLLRSLRKVTLYHI